MIADPICDLLAADVNVTGMLPTWEGQPAIFDFEPAPESCPNPVITVTEGGGPPTGARDTRGWWWGATINIWVNKNHSRKNLRDLMLHVIRAIDRQHLTLRNPYCEVGCWADAGNELTDRDGFPGYVVPVKVLVLEGSGALA